MKKPMVKSQQDLSSGAYVLMTAAHNEELHIETTIQSVLAQTYRPKRWVIVSDASTDRTDQIIESYAHDYEFISFIRHERSPGRSYRSKVIALQNASRLLEGLEFGFIGNLDADVSVDSSYFEDLIKCFRLDPKLGLAAGFVCEKQGDSYETRRINRIHSVAHAAQLVRRECYEAIGGYAELEHGGEDWHAQILARMNGWTARAVPELQVLHHRPTGTADNLVKNRFREGRSDYDFGSDPVFELLKCFLRFREKPFLLGGIVRLAGFAWGYILRKQRPVSSEVIAFLRNEQRHRLFSFLGVIMKQRKLDLTE
jgi:poly-beta-1,6-N-acetyl-D-glucosamine synthase